MVETIEDQLDYQISDFIEDTYIERKKEYIYRAFELLHAYQYEDPETIYVELLVTDSLTDSVSMQDTFIVTIHSQLDEVLHEHRIVLTEDSSLYIKVEILTALYDLMYLVDYSYVLTELSTDDSNDIKLAKIISDSCLLSVTDVLENIIEYDAILLKKLYELAIAKEDTAIITIDKSKKEIISNMKLYNSMFPDTIGYSLLQSGVAANNTLKNYLALISDSIDFNSYKDIDELAIQIFSLLLISRSNLNGILLLYNKYSSNILSNINTITNVEPKIMSLLQEFLDVKKHKGKEP